MRKFLILGALAAAGLVNGSQPSEAYFRGTWCAHLDNGGGAITYRCDFRSYEACRSFVNAQPRSTCITNNWNGQNWAPMDRATEQRFNRIFR
jgi:hypothetical protein